MQGRLLGYLSFLGKLHDAKPRDSSPQPRLMNRCAFKGWSPKKGAATTGTPGAGGVDMEIRHTLPSSENPQAFSVNPKPYKP